MDFVISVVKGDLGGVLRAGQIMLSSLFLLAVLIQYLGILQHQTSWTSLLMRLVIGFILLQNYVWIMDTTKDIVIGLDRLITPDQNFINQYALMTDNLRQQYEQNVQQSIISQVLNFGKDTLHNLIINLSFIFYAVISKIMEAIRYSLTAILYKLGPVLIPLILFNSTKRVISGWFSSYVCVLAWPILWHITLSIAVAISARMGLTGEGIEFFVALNFAVGFILIFSPMIVSSLAAGIGTGAAASLAGALASKTVIDKIQQVGRMGVAGVSGAMSGGIRAMSNMIPGNSLINEKLRSIVSSTSKLPSDKSIISEKSKNPFDSIRKTMKGTKNE